MERKESRASPGKSSPMGRRSTPTASPPQRAPVPAATAQVGMPMQQKPALVAQMAATAGGSTVGQAVGYAITGEFSGGHNVARAQEEVSQQQIASSLETRHYFKCTQEQSDEIDLRDYDEIDELEEKEDETHEENGPFIIIKVTDPQKTGEGIGSYTSYKVSTRTNIPGFRASYFVVYRRFSDFLGLHEKLAEKYSHLGRIVPPAPEKDAVNNAKVIISGDDSTAASEFLEKRAALLTRFINRIARHPVFQSDPNFREFIELDSDFPRASTSALSGATFWWAMGKLGETISKLTLHMDETDPWFEEKQNQIDLLDQRLRKLHASVEELMNNRKEFTESTGSFAVSAAMLGNCEEITSITCALSSLAETHEKIEELHADQIDSDFHHLAEPIREYISLIGVIKDLFHQRSRVYHTWQHAQQMLHKKRQAKAQHDLAGKPNSQDQEEIIEWEAKVARGQQEFDQISDTIKSEVEKFDFDRVNDFKSTFIKYMETLLQGKQQLVKFWEAFLPEAKDIS